MEYPKRLMKIAKKIAKLEKMLDNLDDFDLIKEAEDKITDLTQELTTDELIAVDEIIQSYHLV